MNTKAILLAAILGVGAIAALAPTAAADDVTCHEAGDAAEVCYNKRPWDCGDYLVGFRVLGVGQDYHVC